MDEVILATANVSGFSWGGTGSDAAKTSVEREGEKSASPTDPFHSFATHSAPHRSPPERPATQYKSSSERQPKEISRNGSHTLFFCEKAGGSRSLLEGDKAVHEK